MAKKKVEGGVSYGPDAYLVVENPEQPSTWHLRFKDETGKVNHRLLGACWAALHGGYRGNKYAGPQAQQALKKLIALYKSEGLPLPNAKMSADTTTLEVEFSAESEDDDGDDLLLSGRLFKTGNYPDKAFELTPDELYQSIANFLAPVPFDLEHKPAVFGEVDLTGAFGQIERVWADDAGEWMMATARKPKWLHNVMKETRVSATFTRDTKDLIGAAWTSEPRVSGAELVAAFAATRHDTPTGQMAMQRIHDVAAEHGAVCKRVSMASRHESKGIQDIHDTAVAHGAKCASMKGGESPYMFNEDQRTVKPRSARRMNIREWLLGKANEEGVNIEDLDAAFSREPDPKVAELEKQLADEKQRNEQAIAAFRKQQEDQAAHFARIQAEKRQADAAKFSGDAIQAHRIAPASQDALTALAARVAETDSTATFSDGEKPTSTLLQEFVNSLPDLSIFTTNQVKADQVAALFNTTKTKGVGAETEADPEEVERLLAATPLGRKIIKDRQSQNGSK